jgi:hypothetical protein
MFSHAYADYRVNIITSKRTLIDHCREQLIEVAKTQNPDYILWVDADQTYPANTVKVLANHIDEGCMVVSGVTPCKDNGKIMALKFPADGPLAERVEDFKISRGMVKADCIGGAGVMWSPKIFDVIHPPYFSRTELDPRGMTIGEDVSMYWKLKQAGIDLWIDTDLHFGHIVTSIMGAK